MNYTRRIQPFIGIMVAAAVSASAYSVMKSHSLHLHFALMVLAMAAATSRMKVKLPGINGNMSVNLPFLLVAVVNLSGAEAVAITLVSTLVQCWPQSWLKQGAKLKGEQMIFNLSMMAFATCMASLAFHAVWLYGASRSMPLALVVSTAALLLGQTIPVSAIVAISENKSAGPIWFNVLQLSFPYYVLSAGVTSMLQMVGTHMGWPLALGVFPVMYGIHSSYRLYFSKVAETPRTQVLVRAANA